MCFLWGYHVSPINQKVFNEWWEHTEQEGNLIHVGNFQKVDNSTIDPRLRMLIDLIWWIDGNPCNNLVGSNGGTRYDLDPKIYHVVVHLLNVVIMDEVVLLLSLLLIVPADFSVDR